VSCERIQLEISALLDGNLTPAEAEEVRDHCRRCSACREFLEEQRELSSFLRSHDPSLQPPEHLWLQLSQRIEDRSHAGATVETRHPWWNFFRLPRWIYATGVAAALLYLSLLVFDLSTSTRQEKYLAELDQFNIQVTGNPFLSTNESTENPFLEVAAPQTPNNPFQSGSSQR